MKEIEGRRREFDREAFLRDGVAIPPGVMTEHGVARPGKHLMTDHRVLLGGLVQLDPGDLGDKLIECRERDGGVDGVSR